MGGQHLSTSEDHGDGDSNDGVGETKVPARPSAAAAAAAAKNKHIYTAKNKKQQDRRVNNHPPSFIDPFFFGNISD